MRSLAIILVCAASVAGCTSQALDLDLDSVPFTPSITMHSFASGTPDIASFRVTTDAARFNLTIEWIAGPADACTARPDAPPTIRLLDPSGAIRGTIRYTSPLVRDADNCGMPADVRSFATIEGSWRLEMEGQGGILAAITASS